MTTALELMELQNDKERLDWLRFNSRVQDVYWRVENEGGTVREAIDWFMKQEERES